MKETRYPFYKRLGGTRDLFGRVRKVHPYHYSNPGPSITQRVATCITLSGPTFYKSKEDSYGTNTIFSTSDVVKAPKNINFNTALTFICSFDSLILSSYNVRSLFTACKHIHKLTLRGPRILSIFLPIYFQQDATLHSLFISGKLLYTFRVVSPPIIRSTHNCI